MKKKSPLSGACQKYEADLVLYYYGESGDSERRRIEGHLSGCAGCQRFIDDLRGLLPQLNKGPELPQNFWQSYYRETVAKLGEHEARSHWWSNFIAPLQQWFVPAFGTAAVVILALGLIFTKGSLPVWKERSPTTLPQEIILDGNQLEFFRSLDMLEAMSQLEDRDGGGVEREFESLSFDRHKQSVV